MRRHGVVRGTVVVAVVGLLVAGCGGGADDEQGATAAPPPATTSAPAPPTSEPPPSPDPTASATATGCVVAGPAPAEGAVTADVGDVDGDGADDSAWLAPGPDGSTTVGIATAAGGASAADVTLTGPSARSLLVADADGDGRAELFVSDGRTVDLYAFDGCTVQPVLNQEGATYQFDLGFRGNGTGLGCTEVGGAQHLVGLNRTTQSAAAVEWSRTVVELDGLQARNGATDTGSYALPGEQAQADLLSQVTCGDLTLEADGIVLPG